MVLRESRHRLRAQARAAGEAEPLQLREAGQRGEAGAVGKVENAVVFEPGGAADGKAGSGCVPESPTKSPRLRK